MDINREVHKNQFEVLNYLKISAKDITRYDVKLTGNIVISPKTETAKEAMLKTNIPGVKILEVKSKTAPQTTREDLSLVVLNVHPSITEANILEGSGLKSKRLIAAATGNTTWKVRLFCTSKEQKEEIAKKGLKLNCVKYKAEAYKVTRPPLQCYKCQGLGHMAFQCNLETKCMRCAGPHSTKDCTDKTSNKCANCQGEHSANSSLCPKVKIYKPKLFKRPERSLMQQQRLKKVIPLMSPD